MQQRFTNIHDKSAQIFADYLELWCVKTDTQKARLFFKKLIFGNIHLHFRTFSSVVFFFFFYLFHPAKTGPTRLNRTFSDSEGHFLQRRVVHKLMLSVCAPSVCAASGLVLKPLLQKPPVDLYTLKGKPTKSIVWFMKFSSLLWPQRENTRRFFKNPQWTLWKGICGHRATSYSYHSQHGEKRHLWGLIPVWSLNEPRFMKGCITERRFQWQLRNDKTASSHTEFI